MPEIGRKAALEDVTRVAEVLSGADMVFLAAGMGGGTGTGAAPIVAQVARDVGALTVGVVTRPFRFEGRKRARLGDEGVAGLEEEVDTLITIPNERLLTLEDSLTIKEAFHFADKVLSNAVRGISDLITVRGDINVDFADVRTIMSNRGRALMGTGYGRSERRALEAAEMAINSPLLEDVTIDGAMGILVNITGGPDLTMREVSEAVGMIEDAAHEEAHIIFGYVTLDEPCDEVKVTVIATGFSAETSSHVGQRATRHSASSPNFYYTRSSEHQGRASSAANISAPRLGDNTEQVQIAAGRNSVVRAAGPEGDLDIPAFIRKHSE
jgi:cell division protein FtsZ